MQRLERFEIVDTLSFEASGWRVTPNHGRALCPVHEKESPMDLLEHVDKEHRKTEAMMQSPLPSAPDAERRRAFDELEEALMARVKLLDAWADR